MNKLKEQYAAPWSKMAEGWAKLGIGNHPSPHDVAAYEQFILRATEGVSDPSLLLLGATPSLRDMAARHPNFSLTVLDIHPEMIEGMTACMTEKPVRETLVAGDWIETSFPPHIFDAVMGDQVTCNVAYEKWDRFYAHVRDILKPTGAYISRITTRYPETPVYDPHEFVLRFANTPPTRESLTELWNLLCFQTHHDNVSPSDRMYAVLEAHLDRPNIKAYYDLLLDIIPRGKVWDIGRPWPEEKAIIEKYFVIAGEIPDDTIFRDSTKIYSLQPR